MHKIRSNLKHSMRYSSLNKIENRIKHIKINIIGIYAIT